MRSRMLHAVQLALVLGVAILGPIRAEDSPAPPIEAAFRREAIELVVREIGTAKESILMAAYGLSDKAVADALDVARVRGVKVSIVCEWKGNAKKTTVAYALAGRGVGVRLNGKYSIQHNKFMVIDHVTTELGSLNYTRASRRNAENVLVIRGNREIAAAYEAEWRRLWDEATPILDVVGK